MSDFDNKMDAVPTFHRDEDCGEWLHNLLMPEFGMESEAWALDLVRKAQDRLQASRPADERYLTEVLWIPDPTAFTTPGRYVYFSRELLQRMRSEDAVAFVIAHEISHHDLGHIYTFHGQSIWQRLPVHAVLSGLLYYARRLANSPRDERDADANALRMCVESGYDPEKCLVALDILEMLMLDLNQINVVFGPIESQEEQPFGTIARLKSEFRHWKWAHNLGYASLRDRKEALQALASASEDQDSSEMRTASDRVGDGDSEKYARLSLIDEALDRWHTGITRPVADVTEVMHNPTYRTLTARDGQRPPNLTGFTASVIFPALARFEMVRHQLHLLLALLDHADAARKRVNAPDPDEASLQALERLLAEEGETFVRVGGPMALCELFVHPAQRVSDSLKHVLDEMVPAISGLRDSLLELDTAWALWRPEVIAINDRLALITRRRANELGLDRISDLDLIREELKVLSTRVEQDPLAVQADACEEIKTQLRAMKS